MSEWLTILLQFASTPEGQKIIKAIVEALMEWFRTHSDTSAIGASKSLACFVKAYQAEMEKKTA